MKELYARPLILIPAVDSTSEKNPERDRSYRRPRLIVHGPLGSLIRGASWKGVDSTGEIDPENAYPV